jgi:hypothetical protein
MIPKMTHAVAGHTHTNIWGQDENKKVIII